MVRGEMPSKDSRNIPKKPIISQRDKQDPLKGVVYGRELFEEKEIDEHMIQVYGGRIHPPDYSSE